MPLWLYQVPHWCAALIIFVMIETVALFGLFIARRFFLRQLHFSDGINDAISGTVQTIGVFYGITVGLIAVGVWNTNSNGSELVSREASAIGGLYRDVAGYPEPLRNELWSKLREYTDFVIEQDWPAQRKGQILDGGMIILNEFQAKQYAYEPITQGQLALHQEALHAFNNLAEYRRLRITAVSSGLSGVMWAVIWVGAVISIGVAYLYKIEDPKMHAILIGLMSGFLAMVLFMIIINDRPFYGYVSVSPEPYQIILKRLPAK